MSTTTTANELIEKAERVAGRQALDKVLGDHVGAVDAIRREVLVESDADLLSSRIGSVATIGQDVSRNVALLHEKIRVIIEEVASRIESRKYKPAEETLNTANFSASEGSRAQRLLGAEKRAAVSADSVRLVIDFFHELNDSIVQQTVGRRRKTNARCCGTRAFV
jgi:hypothetical protein